MRTRLLVPALVACFVGGACAPRYSMTVAGPKGEQARTDLAIEELLVRNLVAREPAGGVILVSFGKSRADSVDPPQSFFDRFATLPVTLKPVSQYDAQAHPNALLLAVNVLAMTGETAGTVAVTRYRYGVGASDGFTAAVEWRDGAWKVAKTSRHWST